MTTAVIESLGKPDDCDELNAFRNFRDNWLVLQTNGQQLIEQYYQEAPRIVEAINARPEAQEIYRKLWVEIVQPCLNLIQDEKFAEASQFYEISILELKNKFLMKN